MIRKALSIFRKAIIVVLTLAAVGVTVGSIVGDPKRLYRWDVSDQQAVGCNQRIHSLTLIYFKVGDPSKPVIRRSWGGCGFSRVHFYRQPQNVYSSTWYGAYCPSWLLAILFAAYPTIAFIRKPLRRRRERRRKGLCLTCGYDLTGNVSGVCPECGTKVELR